LKKFLTFIILTLSVTVFSQVSENLIPVSVDGKYGYINLKGEIVIEPQFLSAGEFHSGLACVRKHGTFGFINKKGEVTIPYQFDSEAEFYEGYSSVQKLGKKYLIDSKGNVSFEKFNFKSIRKITNENLFIVSTQSYNYGVINLKSEFVVDTIGSWIDYLLENRLEIIKNTLNPESESFYKIVNYKGQTIGELEDFEYISYNENDRIYTARKSLYTDSINYFFDYSGRPIGKHVGKPTEYQMSLDNRKLKCIIRSPYSMHDDKVWFGVLNRKNEILFKNYTLLDLKFLGDNLLLGQKMDSSYILLDTLGKSMIKQEISEFIPYDFTFLRTKNEQLYGIIRVEGKWHYLFANGSIESLPPFLHQEKIASLNYQGFFAQVESTTSFQFFSFKKLKFLPNKFTYTQIEESELGLLKLYSIDSILLLNHDHNEIFRYSTRIKKSNNYIRKQYNTTYVIGSNHFNEMDKKTRESKYSFYNVSHPIDTTIINVPNTIYLFIDTTTILPNRYKNVYHPLLIINVTNKAILLSKIDGYLNMSIEAIDPYGNWSSIEVPYPSSCGNSYRLSELPPKEMYSLSISAYEGGVKTKIRAALNIYDESKKETVIVYSNEIDGFVNPGQFYNLPIPIWDVDGYE